jgi:hypothetical protein
VFQNTLIFLIYQKHPVQLAENGLLPAAKPHLAGCFFSSLLRATLRPWADRPSPQTPRM